MPMVDTNEDGDYENDENYNPEDEVSGDYKALVNLPEMNISNGEENDEVLSKFRAKLYRWYSYLNNFKGKILNGKKEALESLKL